MNRIFLKIKAIFVILMAIIAAIMICWSVLWVFTRPFRNNDESAGKTELVILHWGDRNEDSIVESLCANFEAEHPEITIKRINATANYTSMLQTMIAGGNPPDLFFWNSHMLAQYVSEGIIRDVDDFLAEDIKNGDLPFNFEDLYAQTVNSFKFDGKVTGRGKLYALPTTFTPLGFFYNKNLFDQAGIAYPSDDWNWDEFEAKARAIGHLDDCYGAEFSVNDSTVSLYLKSYGLDFYSDGFSQIKLEEPAVVERLNHLKEWRFGEDAGRMLMSAKSMVETADSAFMSGKLGMYGPVGRWVVPDFRNIKNFDWDFAQIPRGTYRTNMLYVAGWCISKSCKNPRLAWEVARHFARPECQAISARYGLVLPTHKGVAAGPDFVNKNIKPSRDDLFLTATERSSAIQMPAEPAFLEALKVALDEALRMGTLSVEEAMHNASIEWDKALASPLRRTDFPMTPWKIIFSVLGWLVFGIVIISATLFFVFRPKKTSLKEEFIGYSMISPWLIGVLIFVAMPMIISLILAFSKWSGVSTLDNAQWVGLRNWREILFHDPRMLRSMWVTLYYVILMVPCGQIVALSVAALMNKNVRFMGVYRSIWYLPTVLAGVGMAVMWLWVFDSDHGLMNSILKPILALVHLTPPDWFLKDAKWFGVPAFVITSLWAVGGPMLIYLAGLNAIPGQLYESAEIDGATKWKQFLHITLPMLSPVILFNLIMAIIGSFQIFTQAYVMTKGGPGDATRFYVLYLYNKAFELYQMGYASAMAWLLFLVVLILTLGTMYVSRKRVYYEGER